MNIPTPISLYFFVIPIRIPEIVAAANPKKVIRKLHKPTDSYMKYMCI